MTSHSSGDGGIPPRDAVKRGLKRVMTLGGHYGTRNYTVKDLREQKGKRVLVETLPFSPEEAAAAEEAGIDTMKVRFFRRRRSSPRRSAARHPTPLWRSQCRSLQRRALSRRCGLAMTPWRSAPTPLCASGARASSRQPRKLAFQCKVTPVLFRVKALGPAACAPSARRSMRR